MGGNESKWCQMFNRSNNSGKPLATSTDKYEKLQGDSASAELNQNVTMDENRAQNNGEVQGNEGKPAKYQEQHESVITEESQKGGENPTSPSENNPTNAATNESINPPPSFGALSQGEENKGESTSPRNPGEAANPSSESPKDGNGEDTTSTAQGAGMQNNNNEATAEQAPSPGASPQGEENKGASTSSQNPGEAANPASESPKDGNGDDTTSTPQDAGMQNNNKETAEQAPSPGASPKGDPEEITHGKENHKTATKEQKGAAQTSQAVNRGEESSSPPSGQRSGMSTPGPGDTGVSTPTPDHTTQGESSSCRSHQRAGDKIPSDHGQNSTNHIQGPDSTPEPQVGVKDKPVRKETASEPEPRNTARAVIFSLDEDDYMKSLEKWMRSFITDCHHINPTKTKNWKEMVENAAIVIVYCTSSSYESFMNKMGQYMEHWKGNKKVIVVIGDIQASEGEVRSEWEVHIFTKTELQWIFQDPRLQEMSRKIRQIRDIVLGEHQKRNLMRKQKLPVKFVTLSDIEKPKNTTIGIHWLQPLLRVDEKVKFTSSKISKIKDLLKEMKTSPMSILHFTTGTFQKNITELQCVMEQKEKNHLSVVVVVDDLDDERSEEHLRALYEPKYKDFGPLFLFRREERQPKYLEYVSSEPMAEEKWSKLQKSIETIVKGPEPSDTPDAATCPPPDIKERRNIGVSSGSPCFQTTTTPNLGIVSIFSRSSNTDYSWIEAELKSPRLNLMVSSVRPFYISNNQSGKFYEELGICSFGILYHTKNRGRVNVTDVTDSLYDEELKDMSELLGRENVIVVIDDLKVSNDQEKERILTTQPSINEYAIDLLLYSEQEKKDEQHKEKLREAIISLAAGNKTSGTIHARNNQKQDQTKNPDEREKKGEDEEPGPQSTAF